MDEYRTTQHPRVLIVEPEGHEGHWPYVVVQARALRQRGVDVRLATLSPYERMEELGEIPVTTLTRRRGSAGRRPWELGKRFVRHAEKIARLAQVVRDFRPDVVHLQGSLGRLDFWYFALMKRVGIRIAYTAHDLTPSSRLRTLDRFKYQMADRILVHSWNGVVDLKHYGVDESRIVRIPHVSYSHLAGNGAGSREEAKAALGLPTGASVLLFFGHIEPRKRLDLLIDAHARLNQARSNTYVIIAGRPLEEFSHYMNRINSLGLSDRMILDLRYIPFDQMRVYFSAADVVVLPYSRVYQSGVLQWAYAFGRPVVVTNVGGIGEAVAADGTGVVADGLDGKALARAIMTLLTDTDRASKMGSRAARIARTESSMEFIAEKLEALYREMVEGAQARCQV